MHQSQLCSVFVYTNARGVQTYPMRYGSKLGLARRSSANKVAMLTTHDIPWIRLLTKTCVPTDATAAQVENTDNPECT